MLGLGDLYSAAKKVIGDFATDFSTAYTTVSTGFGGFLDDIGDDIGSAYDSAYNYISGSAREDYLSKNLFYDDPTQVAPSSLYNDASRLYNTISTTGRQYIEEAQDFYGEFRETPIGRAIDAAAGPTGDAGFGNQKATRVARAQVPGGVSAGTFRSNAVDLRAGFADPRISNAMQSALTSENPRVQLALTTITPTLRGGGMTIATGSSRVTAPKIRKMSSKKTKSTS